MEPSLQQVLDVVLQQVNAAATLVRSTVLNKHCQQVVLDATKANLPALINSCKGYSDDPIQKRDLVAMRWLCSKAGPAAVNVHEAGCAILHLVACHRNHMASKARLITDTGLKITNNLVSFLARNHPNIVREVLELCDASAVDKLYVAFTTTVDHDADEVAKLALLLPRVTAAVLPDLLRITCSQGCRAMTDMLLRYDMDCLYVLHPRPTGARNANRQRSTAESAQQALQAQELIVELLLEAVKGGDQTRVHRLCSVPAAQKLGVLAVTQLLFTAVFSCDAQAGDGDGLPCPVAAIAALSAAKSVPAASIAAMLHHGIRHRDASRAAPLLRLPGAKQIGSQKLCIMLEAAVRAKLEDAAWELGRLADGRQLDRADVMAMLKSLLSDSNPYGSFHEATRPNLGSLNPGRHITPDDVLELFEYCAASEWRIFDWTEIATLDPAAEQISDIPRFVNCLKAPAVIGCENDLIHDILNQLPAMHLLQSADWFDILQCCMGDAGFMPEGVEKLPAVQQMSSEHLAQLLRLTAEKYPEDLPRLMALPAAAQLPPAAVFDILKLFVQLLNKSEWEVRETVTNSCYELLKLPQAKGIPVADVQQLLDAAWAAGLATIAQRILQELPQASGLDVAVSGERLVQRILAACNRCDAKNVALLGQDPELLQQRLSVADIEGLFIGVLSISASDWVHIGGMNWFLRELAPMLPVYQQIGTEAVLQMFSTCVSVHAGGYVDSVSALPAAAQLSADQVLSLLQLCLSKSCASAAVWKCLLGLPGGQQLSHARLEELLSGVCYLPGGALDVVRLLAKHPAAEAVGEDFLAGQLEACLARRRIEAVQALLQHPLAKQLSAQQVGPLLQLAMPLDNAPLCEALCALPCAAAGTDPELQMLVQTWQGFGGRNRVKSVKWCKCPLCEQHMQD